MAKMETMNRPLSKVKQSTEVVVGKAVKVDERELDALVKKQWALSSSLGLLVILVVFSIPFLNHFANNFMTTKIWGGFTVTYLAAALLIYPFIWAVAIIYTKKSIELEEGK